MYSTLLLLCAACSISLPAAARQTATDSTYDANIFFIPALGSMPETGFFFGGVAIPQFKVGSTHADTRSSSVLVSALYTLKNQVLVSVVPEVFTAGDRWVLSGAYSGNYLPQDFWGVGPDTPDSAQVKAIYTSLAGQQTVLKRVGRSAFVGPFVRWTRVMDVRFEHEDEQIAPPAVPGATGSTTAGIGVAARLDRRNSVMTPTTNSFLGAVIQAYPSLLGTTNPFLALDLDARKYLNLSGDGRSVLAFQGAASLRSGDPSFYDLAQLGGDEIGRGYYEGRYRDRNGLQVQAEWRRTVYGRIGLTLFSSVGRVWGRPWNPGMDHLHPAAGVGLRINVNRADPTNLRIDLGFGQEGTAFYLQFGEAF